MDDGKDRGVRADSQGECQHGGQRKCWTSPQSPRGMSRLLPQSFECCPSSHISQLLFGQRHTAEGATRRELRVTERNACLHVVLDFQREVDLELAVQLVVFSLAPAPETEVSQCLAAYAGSITRPIAR